MCGCSFSSVKYIVHIAYALLVVVLKITCGWFVVLHTNAIIFILFAMDAHIKVS